MNINQKGFTNVILVVVIVAIVAVAGYFVLTNKQKPTTQETTTPPPSAQPQSSEQPPTTPVSNLTNATKSQALSAINAAQGHVNELKELIQSLENSKSSSLKLNNIISSFIATANAQSTGITVSQAKQSLVKAERHLNIARAAFDGGNYGVALSESREAQIIGITTNLWLLINDRGDNLEQLNARAEKYGNPQNNNPDLASAMQSATSLYKTAMTEMANLDLDNFRKNGNPTENVKAEPQVIDLYDIQDEAGGAIGSADNLLDSIANPPKADPDSQ